MRRLPPVCPPEGGPAPGEGIAKLLFLHVGWAGSLSIFSSEEFVTIRLCPLVLGLFLALSSPAAGEDFGAFSLEIPEGWVASTADGGAVAVVAPRNAAAVTLAVEKLEGVSPEEGARIFARELGGSEPQKTAEGEYAFQFVRNGVTNRSIFRVREERFMLITITDSTGTHGEAIDAMLKSLAPK